MVHFDTNLTSAIGRSRVLVVEGSLWEIPQTIEAILQACDATHQQGVLVALTVSDVSCVKQHHQQFCQSESILLARFAQLNVVIYDSEYMCIPSVCRLMTLVSCYNFGKHQQLLKFFCRKHSCNRNELRDLAEDSSLFLLQGCNV